VAADLLGHHGGGNALRSAESVAQTPAHAVRKEMHLVSWHEQCVDNRALKRERRLRARPYPDVIAGPPCHGLTGFEIIVLIRGGPGEAGLQRNVGLRRNL